ncbi:PAP_central domain-containing protein [Meloidogyne graminicola]|uniref:PAP_central domain-containing protein n=1 Tax=Meloidogyne graminicola TaxID=189291 RepID=A0A8S9ZK17_9BILA|nr:PAP_central domain-containing protein [Meloidogyne graminicola]
MPLNNNLIYSIEEIIYFLKQIIYQWYPNSFVLISGSYLFKSLIPGSDIDIIALLPINIQNSEIINLQYVNTLIFNENNNCEYDDYTLFCFLKKGWSKVGFRKSKFKGVESLYQVKGRVPLLMFNYFGYEIDLLFVQVPCILPHEITFFSNKYSDNLNLEKTDELINQIIFNLKLKSVEDINSTLLPLSEHFIYSGQFGFFNGTNLAVMACKIILLKNKDFTSIIYFLEQFFITFMEWLEKYFLIKLVNHKFNYVHTILINVATNWPNPVLLETDEELNQKQELNNNYLLNQQKYQNKYLINLKTNLNWNINSDFNNRKRLFGLLNFYSKETKRMEKHAKLQWPIITAGIPTQNSGFNINFSTSQILLLEMELGREYRVNITLNSLKNVQKLLKQLNRKNELRNNDKIKIKNKWINWLDGGLFEEKVKYKHFITITSINLNPNNLNNESFGYFCNFVESRIRLQLIYSIEAISEIKYCHAKPGRVWNSEKCPSIILNKLIKENQNNKRISAGVWLRCLSRRLPEFIFISSFDRFEEFSNKIKQKYILIEENKNFDLITNYWPKNQLILELNNKQK